MDSGIQNFIHLYHRLDVTTRSTQKIAHLQDYFAGASSEDADWALWLLCGHRLRRPVKSNRLKTWIAELTNYPLWLVDSCHSHAGDLAETLALLYERADEEDSENDAARSSGAVILGSPELAQSAYGAALIDPAQASLAEILTQCLLPLSEMSAASQKKWVRRIWAELNTGGRLVFNKLLTGGFRVGVHRGLVVKALSEWLMVEKAVLEHRLIGNWQPGKAHWESLRDPDGMQDEVAKPYPFYLASPLESQPEKLGPPDDWLVEWKWDGIRAQLIHREQAVILWSRGEEMLQGRFPEIVAQARFLPHGIVLDGEIVAWDSGKPAPFVQLQHRINKQEPDENLVKRVPIVFLAYDCLEYEGEDIRAKTLHERRRLLVKATADLPSLSHDERFGQGQMSLQLEASNEEDAASEQLFIRVSEGLDSDNWERAAKYREQATEMGTEGLMLKRKSSAYLSGRVKGDWWKWKVDPYTLDLVLTAAEPGHGRRSGMLSCYTFSIRDTQQERLLNVAKAYSGQTDAELKKMDQWIRKHTLSKRGPVHLTKPELVFEIAFEGVQASPRHAAGYALRFPRILRLRTDLGSNDADSLDCLQQLLS